MKNPPIQIIIASQTGNNARGRGANRSVVLATWDNKKWIQYRKFWGRNHDVEAKKFVEEFKNNHLPS